MRIVHVIAGVPVESGGPTQVLRELSARQAAAGHRVSVLTTDSGGAGRRVADAGFDPRVEVRLLPTQIRRSPHPSIHHALASTVVSFDIAHVHGCFALPPSLAMAIFRGRGLPYVLRPCGMLDRYSLAQRATAKRVWLRLGERDNIRGASIVQASSEHEAGAVRRLVPDAEVRVLPQGVEPPPPAGPRPHPRPYLLFLSRIAKKKGLALLVDALPRDLDLVIAGPDEHGHRAEIEARVRARGLTHVHFVGPVRGQAKSDWLGHAEALVLPSEDENFGVVVVEAAHLGTPVIVSDAVGLAPDVLATNAGLVHARTPEALAAAIAERHRPFTPERLAARFHWDATYAAIDAAYRGIVRSP